MLVLFNKKKTGPQNSALEESKTVEHLKLIFVIIQAVQLELNTSSS